MSSSARSTPAQPTRRRPEPSISTEIALTPEIPIYRAISVTSLTPDQVFLTKISTKEQANVT
jgi:hypothetical protein